MEEKPKRWIERCSVETVKVGRPLRHPDGEVGLRIQLFLSVPTAEDTRRALAALRPLCGNYEDAFRVELSPYTLKRPRRKS